MGLGSYEGLGRSARICGIAIFGVLLFASAAVAAPAREPAGGVTLRCQMREAGAPGSIVRYYTVDDQRRTVMADGDVYRVGKDPNGSSGRVITRWSDTEIQLVSEEWYREGWQRFRIVTVLDRLTGAIRSDDGLASYVGNCTVADAARKLF
jgi:hypothetical protein